MQPLHQVLPEASATTGEEIASLNSLLEEEIDKFLFEEEETEGVQVIPILDAEGKSDRHSSAHAPILVVAHADKSSEEEEDEMALNRGGGGVGQRPKGVAGSEEHMVNF